MKLRLFKNLYKLIITSLYPKKCMSCGELIEEEEYLCDECKAELKYADLKKWCFVCGHPKELCHCNYRIYYFHGCASAFYNQGPAQAGYYSYKFNSKIQYAPYFAAEMANAVKHAFPKVRFHAICPVPTSLSSKARYGFDHTAVLCKYLSDISGAPVIKNILKCYPFKKSQHFYNAAQRRENVKTKYYITRKINGGNILLVDDIRTTGATLNECAHQLLKAGASSVYCVTLLATERKKKNEDKR